MRDPRKSIAERYANREEYLSKYKSALDDLVKQRWILEEDRPAVLERGEQEWTEAMSPPIGQVGEAGAAVVADKIEIPNYPPLALQAGISAKIILQVEVKKSGEVNSVRVISGQTDRGYGTAGFVDTATAAAKNSRFSCPTCKGLSFEHIVTYDFQYPPVPEHVCTPKPKETIPPPPPSTTDAPGHVTVRPSKWSCVQI
jgi:TonB family protein